ncbi:LptF/LptG family permease [Flavobacterium sp.]|uniref:LptF/LptG family permease n=1 Tax=Flavobacterium sp. TaxID=239 RepID=UPI002D1FA822|nr:LptF/LptG family permease [Flavobacterium sp.]
MKILDRYLLKSFLVTFASTFVILFFIFVLQVVWLFISELAGKDLDFILILKFLLFKMPSVFPLVLPLSVLLASIMTFGSLAENYEFAAMKSSGISLQRAMRSLIYFIFILSLLAFTFANNVIPYAEYKFINFRRNIAQVKPAMAIAEGQFSQVGSYNIKVEKKSGDNGKFLKGVTIHELSPVGAGSNTVIKAKRGELISSEDSNILKLVLKDGNYYEDIIPKKFEDRNKVPFAKSEFKRYVINIDLSKLNNTNLDEDQITNTNTMLNVNELRYTLDSLQKNYNKDVESIAENINQRSMMNSPVLSTTTNMPNLSNSDILQNFSPAVKAQILRVATSTIDATNFTLESSNYELEDKRKNIDLHWIALYDKFVIAFSCLLMFFIGAPLGAIIRKGGLGLPIVFAILIFIIFHFINTFGKKVAQQDELMPFLGCWLSTIVLAPLAILLTKKATADKGFEFNFDWFTNMFTRFFPEKTEEPVLALETVNVAEAKHYLEEIEEKAAPVSKPVEKVKKAPEKIEAVALATTNFEYKRYSIIALVSNLVLLAVLISGILEGTLLLVVSIVLAIVFYASLIKSQLALKKISDFHEKTIDINLITILLGGFPFFILFYFYNRNFLKEILSTHNTTSV